jgi:putative chitinase
MGTLADGFSIGGLISLLAARLGGAFSAMFAGPTAQPATPPQPALPDVASALHSVLPAVDATIWLPALTAAFAKYGLNTPLRIAAAMGQFVAEADSGFTALRENLNYSAEALLVHFPHEIPDQATADRYADQGEAIGNLVYAGRNGNGDVASGDGYHFRGGGLTQLTGRKNYQAFATEIGMGIDQVADYVATPEGAALSGCWYFSTSGCLPLADTWRLTDITRIVNGPALEGLATRIDYANRFRDAFGIPEPSA